MITLASLFDGIGGALLCAERCGAVPIWASEIEPFPIKVTKYHFPNVKHYGDITKINGSEVEPVDIIVGGSPCQDLSVAGLRKGMKHSDFGDEEETRSGLFMEQIRIVKEMRNAGTNQPRFMVWENVPGAFSSASGEDFRAVLEETARVADASISIPRSPTGWANSGSILGDGFSISWRTVDAQYWGVPQRRRRIYLVADFGGQSAPEILFEREGLRGDIAEGGTEGQRAAGNVENCIGSAGFKGNQGSKAGGVGFQIECAPTVLAGQEGHVLHTDATVLYQPKSALEENWAESPIKNALRAEESKSSHAIVQPVICLQGNGIDRADTAGCNGKGWKEDVCYTLNTIDRPAVAYDAYQHHNWRENDTLGPLTSGGSSVRGDTPLVFENHPQDSRVTGPLDVANSVVKQYGTGGNQVNAVCYGEGGYGDYIEGKVSTVKAAGGALGGGSETFMCSGKKVRRLIPLEAERLQGYPDFYTNIPGASDSARYKALGNSFEIHCAMFVISGCVERIKMDGAKMKEIK